MKTERYKPYFSEQAKVEEKSSTLALLEETIKLKTLLKEEDSTEETIQEETPEVSPDLIDNEEDPQEVAEEGITELLVSIIQKYGMDSEVIDKLLTLGRGLKDDLGTDSSDLVDEIDESETSEEDSGTEVQEDLITDEEPQPQDEEGDQGESLESLLQTYGGGEEAPSEEVSDQPPEEGQEGQEDSLESEEMGQSLEEPQSEQISDKSQEISDQEEAEAKLKDEEEEPLDLADFSFKL